LGNHDKHRIATRVGPAQAKVATVLLLTLRGTPTLYYGDEIGMHDVDIPCALVQDPFEKNVPGKGLGRDPQRTPMQWDRSPAAGFTRGEPWLPIDHDYRERNVEVQRTDPESILALHRRLVALRRGEPALEVGRFGTITAERDVLVYYRRGREGESRFLVALNFTSRPRTIRCPGEYCRGTIAISTHRQSEGREITGDIQLAPDEALVMRLDV
jgi:alpha-glucosidase